MALLLFLGALCADLMKRGDKKLTEITFFLRRRNKTIKKTHLYISVSCSQTLSQQMEIKDNKVAQ